MAERTPEQPWARRPGETAKAHAAFLEYLEMGYGQRSIDKAWRAHQASTGKAPDPNARAHGTWKAWASQHDWVARADAYDADELARMQAGREAAIERAMQVWVDDVAKLARGQVDDATTASVGVDEADPALIRERRAAREYILGSLNLSPKARASVKAEQDGDGKTLTVTFDF